jgi:hypothetical protein
VHTHGTVDAAAEMAHIATITAKRPVTGLAAQDRNAHLFRTFIAETLLADEARSTAIYAKLSKTPQALLVAIAIRAKFFIATITASQFVTIRAEKPTHSLAIDKTALVLVLILTSTAYGLLADEAGRTVKVAIHTERFVAETTVGANGTARFTERSCTFTAPTDTVASFA